MEIQLKNWINDFKTQNNIFPSKNQIKAKALELTEFKSTFKASKGWFEKFIARQFPELIDKTKKRLRKRRIMLPTNRQGCRNEGQKDNRNINSLSTKNNVTKSSAEQKGKRIEERSNDESIFEVIN